MRAVDAAGNLLHIAMRAARGAYLDAEPDLTNAVMSDCLRTVADAYSPDLGD